MKEIVLVTGAGGFLGGELINQLSLKTDYEICALTSNKGKVMDKFSQLEGFSCFDLEDWKTGKLPWEKIGTLIHCAFARISSGKELTDSLRFTNQLFQEASEMKIHSIINVSSCSVYGHSQKPLWTEEKFVDPDSLYALAKYSSEILTNNIPRANNNQIYSANLRLSSLIGNGLNQRVIAKFVDNAIRSQPIKIIGGNQVFSYMDVRDAAAGIIALLSVNPECWKPVYNLGSYQRLTIIEIANLVGEVANLYTRNPIKIEIEEKDIYLDVGMDSSLFYKDTRWYPQYDMKNTIISQFEHFITKNN